MEKGLVKIYFGEGKGKSTSSMGRALVCAGEEKEVFVIQFLKGKMTGSLDYLKRLEPEIKVFRFEREEAFYEDLSDEEKQEEKKENCLSLKGCRVLLVEDNEINREIALEMLREIGVDAESAVNGEECINMLLSHDRGYYSAVLMDIQMPVMDGYEAARKIRSFSDPLKRNIPIIAMTANAFEEDRQKAFRSGMNSHISKPIDTKLLTATLQSCLHERDR